MVGVLLSVDESVLVVGGDSCGDWHVCWCFHHVVGSVSNSAGWPESCNFLLMLLVSGMRVEGCQDRVGSVGKESCQHQKKVEGCLVWQPTLDLRWTGKTGSSYLHCTEVGTKVGDCKLKIYM